MRGRVHRERRDGTGKIEMRLWDSISPKEIQRFGTSIISTKTTYLNGVGM